VTGRPHRLAGFSYQGTHRYSLTFCAHQRQTLFVQTVIVQEALKQILQSAAKHAFAIFAYCFMPDHLHLVIAGLSDNAALIPFAKDVKQRIGYSYPHGFAEQVWQKG
jgi:putative transposase